MLNELTEENGSNSQFFVWILMEKAILIKQIVNNTTEEFLFTKVGGHFDSFEMFDEIVD